MQNADAVANSSFKHATFIFYMLFFSTSLLKQRKTHTLALEKEVQGFDLKQQIFLGQSLPTARLQPDQS